MRKGIALVLNDGVKICRGCTGFPRKTGIDAVIETPILLIL